ncbi:MAG TPA: type II CAAX endopeptidase family protein [Acidimicrobiales bacterium]
MTSPSPLRWGVSVQLGERRVLRQGRWRWVRAMAWLLLLFFLTAAAVGLPLQVVVDLVPPGDGLGALVGPLVGSAAALGGYVLAVRLGEGRWPGELSLRPALPGLAVGAILGLVMMTVLMGTMIVTGLYDITLVGAAPLWTGLGLALQAAVTEELWMRALLLRLLWRAFGPVPAFAVSALVFGGLHLANPGATWLGGATVTAAGLMFCALYGLTGRLWAPTGLHLAWNFAQGSLFGAVVSGGGLGDSIAVSTTRPGAAAWLTGGSFGPEGSVFALLLVGAMTVSALWLARKSYGGRLSGRTSGDPGRMGLRHAVRRGLPGQHPGPARARPGHLGAEGQRVGGDRAGTGQPGSDHRARQSGGPGR